MKAKHVILLIVFSCILVIGAASLKVMHVGNAEMALLISMIAQGAIFVFIVYRTAFSKKDRP